MAFVTYEDTVGILVDTQKGNNTKEYTYQELWGKVLRQKLPHLQKHHRVVIVDADALVYRVSAAAEEHSIRCNIWGKDKEFKNRTELKKYCKELGITFEDIEVEDIVKVDSKVNCLSILKRSVNSIKRDLRATHLVLLIGGSDNFRKDLKLPVQYKSNRENVRRPEHLKACREYLVNYQGALVVSDVEADDAVQGLTSFIINHTDAYGIAWQLDKDFHTSLTKNRYFNPMSKEIVQLSGGLGNLVDRKKGVKGEGLLWICFQLMLGDTSDGYSPKKFFNKKYGEKAFYKQFKDCSSEKELLEKWVVQWKKLLSVSTDAPFVCFKDYLGQEHKHTWLSLAELYFSCLYMKMHPADNTTFESLLLKYGVDYE